MPHYPNANYPQAYDEANMVKAGDVAVNVDGSSLTISEAAPDFGPLGEIITGADIDVNNPQGKSLAAVVTDEDAEVEASDEDTE